jgi:hypothetical protein
MLNIQDKTTDQLLADRTTLTNTARATTSIDRKRIYEASIARIDSELRRRQSSTPQSPLDAQTSATTNTPSRRSTATAAPATDPLATNGQSTESPLAQTTSTPKINAAYTGKEVRLNFKKPEAVAQQVDLSADLESVTEAQVYTVKVARTYRPQVNISYPNGKKATHGEGELRNRITRACRDLAQSKYIEKGGDVTSMRLYQSLMAFERGRQLISTQTVEIRMGKNIYDQCRLELENVVEGV